MEGLTVPYNKLFVGLNFGRKSVMMIDLSLLENPPKSSICHF